MRRKRKQKRRIFDITEIFKRRNFQADSERDDANRVISVHTYAKYLIKIIIYFLDYKAFLSLIYRLVITNIDWLEL